VAGRSGRIHLAALVSSMASMFSFLFYLIFWNSPSQSGEMEDFAFEAKGLTSTPRRQ
jgi:hypothetical protein